VARQLISITRSPNRRAGADPPRERRSGLIEIKIEHALAADSPRKSRGSRPMTISEFVPNSATVEPSRSLVASDLTAQNPQWTETLLDGTEVAIRPIGRGDAVLEREFIARLSPQARRLRFLGSMSEPGDDLIRRLTDIDYEHDVAFIAVVGSEAATKEIGVCRFSVSADGQSCEFAVTVADEWQKKGLGSILMRHLIEVARTRGVRKMISIDAADNPAMRDLARFLGFVRERDPNDATQVIHTMVL
jgi:GNAT superfamily N-acetyltransferase